jgi:hypothetical protein
VPQPISASRVEADFVPCLPETSDGPLRDHALCWACDLCLRRRRQEHTAEVVRTMHFMRRTFLRAPPAMGDYSREQAAHHGADRAQLDPTAKKAVAVYLNH